MRKSQLYVPGHQTKVGRTLCARHVHPCHLDPLSSIQSGIQGFIDPAPFVSKSLRVRYLFRGRMHYAEIPDSTPVVLPLAGVTFGVVPYIDTDINACCDYRSSR